MYDVKHDTIFVKSCVYNVTNQLFGPQMRTSLKRLCSWRTLSSAPLIVCAQFQTRLEEFVTALPPLNSTTGVYLTIVEKIVVGVYILMCACMFMVLSVNHG